MGPGLVLVVFPRSRLCLLHENGNRLLLEMASTIFMIYERDEAKSKGLNTRESLSFLFFIFFINS